MAEGHPGYRLLLSLWDRDLEVIDKPIHLAVARDPTFSLKWGGAEEDDLLRTAEARVIGQQVQIKSGGAYLEDVTAPDVVFLRASGAGPVNRRLEAAPAPEVVLLEVPDGSTLNRRFRWKVPESKDEGESTRNLFELFVCGALIPEKQVLLATSNEITTYRP